MSRAGIGLIFALASGVLLHVPAAALAQGGAIGGCGDYTSIDGSARITSIEETAQSKAQATVSGGPGYAGYEVRFDFTPDQPVGDSETQAWIAKPHDLQLANSWYPGPEFLKKYGLRTGSEIPAVLKVQGSGPCTPFVFEFPSVDTADYFETRH